MSRRQRVTLVAVLGLLGLSTLLGAIFDEDNRLGFAIATTIFHLFLFAAGYALAREWSRLAPPPKIDTRRLEDLP